MLLGRKFHFLFLAPIIPKCISSDSARTHILLCQNSARNGSFSSALMLTFFYRWTTYTLISSVRVLRCDPCDYSLGSQLLIVRRKPLMNILMKKAFFCQGFPDRSREPIKNLSNTTCLHWWKLKTIQYFCWSESVLHICQVCQSIYNNNTVTQASNLCKDSVILKLLNC